MFEDVALSRDHGVYVNYGHCQANARQFDVLDHRVMHHQRIPTFCVSYFSVGRTPDLVVSCAGCVGAYLLDWALAVCS
jgi:hypothetical protein